MKQLVAPCVTAALLAACGGGGGSSSLPIIPTSRDKVSVNFIVNAPGQSSTASRSTQGRRPQYLSPATQSITLAISGPTAITETQNLTINSSGCTSSLASTICTLTVALAPCTNATNCYTASLTTYDQTGGTGNVLSAAQSITFTVTANQSNNIDLTLSGVPARTIVAPTTSLTGEHSANNYDLYAQGAHGFNAYSVDADGNIIVGSGAPTFTVTTNSNAMGAMITGPSSTSPNSFTIAPPGTYSFNTVSVTVTPTFSGQATNGCTQSGANCAGVTITADMEVLVYVVNILNGTIKAFNDEGMQQTLSGTFSNLDGPEDIAYDSSNHYLYVTNGLNGTVTAYDDQGVLQTLTGSFANLNNPTGIAYDPSNGDIYVARLDGTINAYNDEGVAQTLPAGSFPNLTTPYGIAYDSSDGNLYIADPGSDVVRAYNAQGAEQTLSGSFPNLDGPVGIVYDPFDGNLFVVDQSPIASNYKVTAYNGEGVQQSLTGSFPNLDLPSYIAYDPSNAHLYVTNVNGGSIVTVYDGEGNQQSLTGSFPDGLGGDGGAIAIVP